MHFLITGALPSCKTFGSKLTDLGHTVAYQPSEKDAVTAPQTYDAVICNALFMYHDIRTFSRLRFVQLTSAGYDRIPLSDCQAQGITVCNAGHTYAVPMAEWAVLQILSLYKGQKQLLFNQISKTWEKNRASRELRGQRACIIGFGHVGREIAKRLQPFGVGITAVDIVRPEMTLCDDFYPISALREAVKDADILVLALPLTDETRGMFDNAFFGAVKQGAVLVNVARGALLNTQALLEAADTFSGVSLDVFEEEPLPADSPLWTQANFIITPHNAFIGDGNQDRLYTLILQNLQRFLSGADA